MINDFIDSDDPSATIILNDRLKINECLYYFKNMLKKGGGRPILEEKLINN